MATAYDLAIKLSLNNGVSPGLAIISRELLGLQMSAEKLEKAFGKLGTSLAVAVGGAAAIFAGVEIFKGLERVAEKGKELIHQQNQMVRNGFAYNDVLKITQTAYSDIIKKAPTASSVDALRVVNELKSVVGTAEKALALAPTALKIEGLISNSTGKSAEGQGTAIWRAIEDKGIIQDGALTDKMIGLITQAITATAGRLSGSDFFSYARTAKSAWIGDAPEAMAMQVMQMQTSGADTAGTERRMFHRMIGGGQKLSKNQMAAWTQTGMLGADGHILDQDLEQSRPDLFIASVVDHLAKNGIKGQEAVQKWADKALNASSSHYFMVGYTGENNPDGELGPTRLEKERANLAHAQGLNSAYNTMLGFTDENSTPRGLEDPMQAAQRARGAKSDAQKEADYTANVTSLSKAWESLMEAVGGPVARAAIPIMQSLTEAFRKMGEWANNNPGTVEMIAKGAAGLAAALIVVGGVAVVAAALMIAGPIATGAAALAAVMGVMAAINPQAIADAFHIFVAALNEFIAGVKAAASFLGGVLAPSTEGGPTHGKGGNNGPPGVKHSFYIPGGSSHAVTVHTALNIDGRQIAKATSVAMANYYEHSTSAPAADSHGYFAGPDYAMAG